MMERRFKWFALCLTLLLAGSLLVTLPMRKASAQKEPTVQMSESAARQINSLIQEKESRTPAQKKIDSQLLYAAKVNRGERITNEVAIMEINVNADEKGFVPVDIQANVTRDLLKSIEKLGGEIVFSSSQYHSVTARLPLQALEQLASSEDVNFIYPADRARTHRLSGFGPDNTAGASSTIKVNALLQPSQRADFADRAARVRKQIAAAFALRKLGPSRAMLMPTGPVDSQGDTTHRAAEARGFFGVTGSGVKVGVLSDGVNSLAGQQAAGELPAVTVLPGQAGSGDEGTAMLEIVNDIAPGAQLFFATAFTSQASFAANILALRAAGCDIIVDDVGYFREAVFADDNVAQSVNSVTAAGAMYFSSAGNEGNKDDNTSGVWEGDFLDSGTGTAGTVTIAGGTFHNFGGGVTNDQLTASNGGAPIGLFWSDPLGGSSNDYDLYILDAGLTVVVNAATNIQNGTQDPVELSTISPAAGRRLLIFKKTAAALRAVHLNTFRGRLAISTTGQTHGHSAAGAAFSVAATPAAGPIGAPPNPTGPFPGPFNSGNLSELFSSDGPRRVFFNPNGTPVTPGNFLFGTNGGIVRQKPDITAADGTASAVPGFNPFFGTSAAAPHAAAIAALLKSAGSFTPAQIRTALTSSAIDIEAAGTDRDTGAGIVMAYQALQAIGAVPQPNIASAGNTLVNESCPPNNNAIDPDERVTVSLNLTNNGGLATSNLVATLQSSANVIAPSEPQTYGVIAPAGSVARDFAFTAAGTCGSNITLALQLQDGATNLGTVTYSVTLGAVQTTGPTTFTNATAVVIPSSGAATPYPSSIVVSGLTGTISNVSVTLKNLSHTFPEDVGMLLVGPGGQKFVIIDGVIGGTPWANITYTLTDSAAGLIPKPGTPVSGSFKPTDYFTGDVFPAPAPAGPNQEPAPAGSATFASVFNGGNPNGTWSLYVFDFATGDSGTMAGGWDLSITTSTPVCTTPCGDVRLVVTSSLSRPASSTVAANVTVQNIGSTTANNVKLTTAKLGATNGTPLPQSLGNLAPGGSVSTTVFFSNSTPGASSTLTVGGTYTGGTFSSTKRVTIP
jgi:subtilisin-like proprotein convertase family protein